MTSIDTLLDVPIRGKKADEVVPLRSLVTIKRTHGPAVINHRNITRAIDVYADGISDVAVTLVDACGDELLIDDLTIEAEPSDAER